MVRSRVSVYCFFSRQHFKKYQKYHSLPSHHIHTVVNFRDIFTRPTDRPIPAFPLRRRVCSRAHTTISRPPNSALPLASRTPTHTRRCVGCRWKEKSNHRHQNQDSFASTLSVITRFRSAHTANLFQAILSACVKKSENILSQSPVSAFYSLVRH